MNRPASRPFFRAPYATLLARMRERRRYVQVLVGPRQVGKTTLARQVMAALSHPSHYASGDDQTLRERGWIQTQWDIARGMVTGPGRPRPVVLILDEVQKVDRWSETVKRLWDEDSASGCPLRVILLGSSPLLVQRGIRESLAGRFEVVPLTHWSFGEMHEAFGWSAEEYVFFGGYPGAVPLIRDEARWRHYILESLVEATISKDILLMTRVDKPPLLRRMFHLACDYSSEVLSYQKMLGQLRDAGNTVTLPHYLELRAGAGLAAGISKFAGSRIRQRGSSPKLQALNTGLISATDHATFREVRKQPDRWGRLVESAVGAHLVNASRAEEFEVFYWRDGNFEVDFVLRKGRKLFGIEVKSGRQRSGFSGLERFATAYHPERSLVVGSQGIPLEQFLAKPVTSWLH